MKIKFILLYIVVLLSGISCSPDDLELYTNPVSDSDIKIIELRADHKTMIPDHKSKMEFRIVAYGVKDFKHLIREKAGNASIYRDTVTTDTFIIPENQLPEGFIKVYDENGKVVENNTFTTLDKTPRTVKFYAQGGNLKSNELKIEIRSVPDESYPEIVYPVIFHIINLDPTLGAPYNVSVEELQKRLDKVNLVFNREITTNPNGGNAKIRFRLANYDEKGNKLAEAGKHRYTIPKASSPTSEKEYYDYINRTAALIWDPTKYLNIWMVKHTTYWSSDGAYSYIAEMPNDIYSGEEAIPGQENPREVSSFGKADMTDFSEVGILINFRDFFNPAYSVDPSESLELSTIIGYYLGLKSMTLNDTDEIVDGDTDYCPDTYFYVESGNFTVFKSSYSGKPTYYPKEYFTSFNIMEKYSRKNSITADQAARLRLFAEKCPSRWSYKSQWAFEGM